MGELQKRLKALYEQKKKEYSIKHPWNPERENDYAVFCARDLLEIVDDIIKEFPKFVGYGGSHDELFDDETKIFEWYKKWFMPSAQKSKE